MHLHTAPRWRAVESSFGLLVTVFLVGFTAPLASAAPNTPATVKDRLWVWGHDVSFDWEPREEGTTPAKNRMTPVEGAVYMGVPNIMFIQYNGVPASPFEQYYTPFKAMKQVYWTLSDNSNKAHSLGEAQEHVYQLAAENPNITGLLLDDYVGGPHNSDTSSQWLAENNVEFPVDLVLTGPREIIANSLVLRQTAWKDGGYRTGEFVVEVSKDGSEWQKIASGEMPIEPGAIKMLTFAEQRFTKLRVKILSTQDTAGAMSVGLKDITLFHKGQPVALEGFTVVATSEYPGHEAGRLVTPRPTEDAAQPNFNAQVTPEDLAKAKARMQSIGGRKLDLAVVVYSRQLEPEILPYLKDVDTILFWVWMASDLKHLEDHLKRLKELVPDKKVFLGCYLWDFGTARLMPLDLMQLQCETGLKWLKAGEIEGMIFLSTNVTDKNLKAVNWTRDWIAKVGDQPLK